MRYARARILELLVGSLFFLLPLGLRKAVFTVSLGGEYETVFIYATDFIALAVGFLWLQTFIRFAGAVSAERKVSSIELSGVLVSCLVFLVSAALSLLGASVFLLAAGEFAHLALGLLLFFAIRHWAKFLLPNFIAFMLLASAALQAVLGGLQFILQRSIGLHVLGEALINPSMQGVAKIELLDGTKFIRAYGLFPHPNVLAAFLVAGIFALGFLFFSRVSYFAAEGLRFPFRYKVAVAATLFVLLAGLAMTFSRAGWLAFGFFWFGFLGAVWYRFSSVRRETLWLCALSLVSMAAALLALAPFMAARIADEPFAVVVAERFSQIGVARELMRVNVFFGVGMGNYVPVQRLLFACQPPLPCPPEWFYEPVHNLYALVAAETGAVGLVAFVALIGAVAFSASRFIFTFPKRFSLPWTSFFFAGLAFLFMALVDHYFWTFQQGRLLFWMMLGLL